MWSINVLDVRAIRVGLVTCWWNPKVSSIDWYCFVWLSQGFNISMFVSPVNKSNPSEETVRWANNVSKAPSQSDGSIRCAPICRWLRSEPCYTYYVLELRSISVPSPVEVADILPPFKLVINADESPHAATSSTFAVSKENCVSRQCNVNQEGQGYSAARFHSLR